MRKGAIWGRSWRLPPVHLAMGAGGGSPRVPVPVPDARDCRLGDVVPLREDVAPLVALSDRIGLSLGELRSSVTFATRVCAESVLVALVHRLRRPLQVPQAVVRPHVVLVAGLGPPCPPPPETLQHHHVHLPARPSPPHREHHVHVARAYIDL